MLQQQYAISCQQQSLTTKMGDFVDTIYIDTGVNVVRDKLFGYRIVHPIKNKDGTLNWKNLLIGGSWGNLLMVVALVALMVYLVWQYNQDISQAVECCNAACTNLVGDINSNMPRPSYPSFNISGFNYSG